MSSLNNHQTVLLNESIKALNIKANGIYVDCTYGRGGHSELIATKLNNCGQVIAIDKDLTAQIYFKKENKFPNIKLINADFSSIEKILKKLKINKVDGFLFDLGVSSPQLDDGERGFSYLKNANLDMRMNQEQLKTAFDVINKYELKELIRIFKSYGDSKYAFSIAKKIVEARSESLIKTTFELVSIIKSAVPTRELFKPKHPARQIFQAIRIEVNNEIEILEPTLEKCANLLSKDGRIVVISFHSLEEKIVKRTFMKLSKNKVPSYIPIKNNVTDFSIINLKIKPTKTEIEENRRSRSARLKILIRNKE